MAANAENRLKGDAPFLTEKPESYILQQCLDVVTTFTEFSNLTFRLSRTCKDVEVMTVYRNQLQGVFGPPLDPITLTIDPNGRCLVSILFKPVQRVSLASGNNGGLDILSLIAVLRLIAGKGFLLCPGIPEKVLMGRASGRYVECHRAPFKRFQSPQCPVYYQKKVEQEQASSPSPSVFKMCPQCRQVATTVLKLPPVSQVPRGGTTQNLVNLEKLSDQTQNAMVQFHNVPTQSRPTSDHKTEPESYRLLPAPLLSLPVGIGGAPIQSSGSNDPLRNLVVSNPQQQNTVLSTSSPGTVAVVHNLKRSSSEPKGQRLPDDVLRSHFSSRSPTTTEALRNVLQKRIKLDVSKPQEAEKTAGKDIKNRKGNRNICRICKKLFSSPANLLNHLQRHEGFSGSLSKPLTAKLSAGRQNSSAVLRRMVLWGAKTHSNRKKNSPLSGTSLRLFMKCLNNLMSTQNNLVSCSKNSIKQNKRTSRGSKNKKHKVDNTKASVESQTHEITERPSLSRSSSGLSAMQTLLEAAAIAGINSGSLSSAEDYDAETASYTTSPHSTLSSSGLEGSETKQHRKSPRIASRLKKKKELANSVPSITSPGTSVGWPKAMQPEKLSEPGHLTNLDLLSSVSLDLEKRSPIVSSSPHASAVSLPQPVTVSNTLLKMPQNTSIEAQFGGPPPLLFAQPGKDGKLPSWVPQSNAKQALNVMLPQSVSVFNDSIVSGNEAAKVTGQTPDCGAMDLTKPKLLKEVLPGLISTLDQPNKVNNVPLMNLPKPIPSSEPDNIPVQVLMNSGSVCQQQIPNQSLIPRLPGIVSMNKLSDVSLQSRMYASARDYKMDKKSLLSGPQIHAMVASRGGASKPGSDEIQCGYKWSGSGGQVKERTQMVRELVPQDVMASYLNKQFMQPQVSHPTVPVQQDIPQRPILPEPKGPRLMPRSVLGAVRTLLPQHLKSLPKFPSPNVAGDEVSCQVALNLTTARQKGKEANPRGKSATRPKRQSRKGGSAAQAQLPVNIPEIEIPSPIAVPSTMESAGQSYHLQGSGVTLSCTFSSPSLAAILQEKKEPTSSSSVAAILQQPAATSSNSVCVKASIKASSLATHGLNNGSRTYSNSAGGLDRAGSQQDTMKFESHGTPSPRDDGCVILSLPIKPERSDSGNRERHGEREGSASPGNLVVDLPTDPTVAATGHGHTVVKQETPIP
ncbi:hypothetical protein ElyMa_006079800 [Elysia marginata]|uniref:C2H2-type domain-containing protein n=1 Tax=Elysia marginata TaxID=1093978 RepID=A0AAV4GRK4_9GAST|nr:hypothetical protein ElyMa_006079800 [Elysia marginata]